ncbi:MAG TPA: PIN domain-containing protein [Candidatus Nanoarchaeia archaeon]|nr:PIN domain-containing protein [Candidatus Nanoarchaeia archaeon]
MKAFVDANVMVKAFTENPDKEKCIRCLKKDFMTDALCLVEAEDVISIIKKDHAYASSCIKSLLKSSAVILPVGVTLLFESSKRVDKYKLDAFDRIHYVAALLNNCTEFISYDKDFDGLEIKRIEP